MKLWSDTYLTFTFSFNEEEKLLATMTEEHKELFSRYTDCVREHLPMAECLLFQNSFRLGGRMMLEVMGDGVGDE